MVRGYRARVVDYFLSGADYAHNWNRLRIDIITEREPPVFSIFESGGAIFQTHGLFCYRIYIPNHYVLHNSDLWRFRIQNREI